MKRNLLILIYFLLRLLCPSTASAQPQTPQEATPDSIRISLLTCASGGEIYSLFGHTAIRYENFTRGIDAVFNYGMFNFNAPNFIFRFALGETDYQLGVTNYEHFASEYNYLGRDVWQQTSGTLAAQRVLHGDLVTAESFIAFAEVVQILFAHALFTSHS